MLSQSQQLKLKQLISPQQIQFIKLLQIPTATLDDRIKEELTNNPALEDGKMETDSNEAAKDEYSHVDDDNNSKEDDHDDFNLNDYMDSDGPSFSRLGASVVPSLLGWGAVFLPASVGLLTLAGGFLAMLFFDWHASQQGRAPAWYPRLRWPLTATVVASLILASLG